MLNITVLGLGYIGLPTAIAFANSGFKVFGFDINNQILNQLSQKKLHIEEPGLSDLFDQAVQKKNFVPVSEIKASDIFIIAVPTPSVGKEHLPDTSHVLDAANSIASKLKKGDTIIIESTCPVGTTDTIGEHLKGLRNDLEFLGPSPDIGICYCPERVLPGKILDELKTNDRIIGTNSQECFSKVKSIYSKLTSGKILMTSPRTAEMTKLVENSFRDINIAFANELSMICHDLKVDVEELISLANQHPRVNILNPGPGVGGHCIAIDPWFLVHSSPENTELIKKSRLVNIKKESWVLNCINEFLEKSSNNTDNLKICIMGFTFKPNVSDLRESPAINITKGLMKKLPNSEFLLVDKHVKDDLSEYEFPSEIKLIDIEEAFREDIIFIILVKHQYFEDFFDKKINLSNKKIIDFVGLLK